MQRLADVDRRLARLFDATSEAGQVGVFLRDRDAGFGLLEVSDEPLDELVGRQVITALCCAGDGRAAKRITPRCVRLDVDLKVLLEHLYVAPKAPESLETPCRPC